MPISWPKGKRPCFIGSGNVKATRSSTRSLASLASEAVSLAIADAGLRLEDIDGLSVYPEAPYDNASRIGGLDSIDIEYMQQILPWENIRWFNNFGGRMTGGAVIPAAHALAQGACNYVVTWRALHHPVGERYNQSRAGGAAGDSQFSRPYGWGKGGQIEAMRFHRYLEKFGAKREELADVVLNANRNAQLNPYAVWNGRTITRQDYLNSRFIAWPMCLFDNDMPVDAAGALVMTTEERAKDAPQRGGYIAGYSVTPYHHGARSKALEGQFESGLLLVRNLWESCGLKPSDIDLLHIYDGFSPMVWFWLEAFGFCPVGEAHNWARLDGVINLEGSHPMNTAGGNLGEGRLHGWGQLRETAEQLMGKAGPRQLPRPDGKLKKLDTALCGTGPFGSASVLVCTRE